MASAAMDTKYVCPECGERFAPKHWRSMFCSAAHRDNWHNRQTTRGRVLTSFVMVARQTRDGTRGDRETGKRASADANVLMQRWRDEDRDAGRMQQVDYMRRRYALGFEPTA